jgi:hypothetical protein
VRHDGQCQRRDVGIEEAVEAAADAVVVERGHLLRGQPEPSRVVACGPLADAVEGFARHQKVLDQDEQADRGGYARPTVLGRGMAAEGLVEAEPAEEAVEDRQVEMIVEE